MSRVPGEHELVVVVFGREGAGEVFVGKDPVVHVVAHDVGVQEIGVADLSVLIRSIRGKAFCMLVNRSACPLSRTNAR